MKLEYQVCNLELSKRLKELGVKQESLFWWQYFEPTPVKYEDPVWKLRYGKGGDIWEHVSAFTVAELLLLIESSSNEWACGYDDSSCSYRFVKGERGCGSMMQGFGGKSIFNSNGYERNFTDALASWVVYLIQNKLIEVSK